MDATQALIRNLCFEYHGICAANNDYTQTKWDFLIKRGIEPDDIWQYAPNAGWDADQPEPDWM